MMTLHKAGTLIPLALLACSGADRSAPELDRQEAVAVAGAQVMPFNLDESTHIFEKIENGGLQQVVSDADDPEQVSLIREHLGQEAERFARGDFHDPAMIHGDDMAGMHELVTGHDRIAIQYSEIEGGGQILYTSADPTLVAAIHRWFDAQLSDHGEHARSGR